MLNADADGRPEERRDDARLLALALARQATDSGERIGLEDAAASLGVDLAELD